MDRRHLFTLPIGAALALGGCAKIEAFVNDSAALQAANLKLLAGYTNAIATGLSVVVPVVVAARLVSAADGANISTGIAALKQAAQTVGASSDLADAATISAVKTIALVVNSAVDATAAVPTPPMPATAHLALLAAGALLPVIESLVGLFTTPSPSVAQAAATIPPAAAQTILLNAPAAIGAGAAPVLP